MRVPIHGSPESSGRSAPLTNMRSSRVYWMDGRADDPSAARARGDAPVAGDVGVAARRVEIERVLDSCGQLMAERVRIERILAELGPAWGGARRALNELHKVLRPSR